MKASLFALIAAGFVSMGTVSTTLSQEQKIVKIGVLTDMSGSLADSNGPGSVHAVKMAVDEFNASSKAVKAEVVSADHQNKADIGSSIIRRWFDQEKVDAVVDVPNSAVALAVNQLARDNNKVFLNSGASSSDFTGKACSPNQVHWTYDTYALAAGTAKAVVSQGGNSWYLLTADYAFGHTMEQDVRRVLEAKGAKVIGSVRHPLNTADFSSFLLQAQASGAKVIGLINAGTDTSNSIRTAGEFGIIQGGQQIAAMVLYLTDVHSLGLKAAQGLEFTSAFYWDMNDGTRAWAKQFSAGLGGKYPTQLHAGAYAATLHYLKSVESLGSGEDGKAIVAKMESGPLSDPLFGTTVIRKDGRALHDMYLFQVKKPEESKGPYDYYQLVSTIPADQAFRPIEDGGCSYVTGSK